MTTAPLRALPDFLILGAQKAGTTSLYTYLSAHPNVRPGLFKEAHFFDLRFARGERWYRAIFPLSSQLARSRAITGEASPYYLYHPLAAERAAKVTPSVRLIVLLRNPIERAWSHYRQEVADGREPLSFIEAIRAEPRRLDRAEDALRAGGPADLMDNHRRYSYVGRGRYAEQLARWFAAFPREQVLVLRAEDLFHEPTRIWAQVESFLDLPFADQPEFRAYNAQPYARLPPEAGEELAEIFQRPNDELRALLGPDVGWPKQEGLAGEDPA
ncbi:MAG: sulfotransferase domain-containing protein [Actinomycetota bacterium]|nr:sulfotransferase domain-containing protein [Actinomycetota bacterium]